MVDKDRDLPFYEVLTKADQLIGAGWTLHQKFTCDNCGNRLTMEAPNKFYISGTCDNCGHLTDIRAKGCGFMATLSANKQQEPKS